MASAHAPQLAPHRRRPLGRLVGVAVALALATVAAPTATGAQGTIAEELAKAYDEANAIAAELSSIETELARLEDDIAAYDEEIEAVRSELDAMADDVRDIAIARYVSANNGPITYSDDLVEHQRLDVLVGAVQRDARQTMDAFEDAQRRLESSSRALATRLDDQDGARDRLAQRLDDLDAELERLHELQRQAELEAARIEAERAAEEARRAEAAAATSTTTTAPPTSTTSAAGGDDDEAAPGPGPTSPPPTSPPPTSTTTTTAPPGGGGGSGFRCPVQGVSVFTDSWGAPRSGGRQHMGVDMLASIGTPAVAPVSGRVEHRWNDTGGHSYHLQGDDGNFYYGTHLSAYGASGQVSAGTVIGYVGDTGNAAGIPHLHFEIHIGGRGNPVNPYPTVRAAC